MSTNNDNNFAEPKFTGFSLKKKPTISFKKNTAFSKIEPEKENQSENPNAHFDRKLTNKQIKKAQVNSSKNRKSQMIVQQALEQDDEIFEYDAIHDQISSTRLREKMEEDRRQKNQQNRAPKYIKQLMKTAAKRNLESERRYENRAIRDRKDEDHLYEDKEKFVTPAFKAKMEQLAKAEKEEERLDAIDSMQSVEKQDGISGFYRHFLNDTYEDPTKILRTKTGKSKEEKIEIEEIAENVKIESKEEEDVKKPDGNPENTKRTRHDSSSESEAGSINTDEGGNLSNEQNLSDDEDQAEKNESQKELENRFRMPLQPGLTLPPSKEKNNNSSSKNSEMAGFAPASTTFTTTSQRTRVTAGGAGVETEIDYDYQLYKLGHIFRKKLSNDDVEAYRRKYQQRHAMREAKGGWNKILSGQI